MATTTQLVQEITDLIENNKYEFCVRAVNKYGAGEGAEIGPITANFTFGKIVIYHQVDKLIYGGSRSCKFGVYRCTRSSRSTRVL